MFKTFVLITGLLNFPIGMGIIVQALIKSEPESLVNTVVLGAFILFAGAVLVWVSRDLNGRGSVLVWAGLVRLTAVAGVAYTFTIGSVPIEQLVISSMDLIVALIYFVGVTRHTGVSFVSLLTGKADRLLPRK